jgi:hypothetical protein
LYGALSSTLAGGRRGVHSVRGFIAADDARGLLKPSPAVARVGYSSELAGAGPWRRGTSSPGAAVGPARPSPYRPTGPHQDVSVPARAFLPDAIGRVGPCHSFCVAGSLALWEEGRRGAARPGQGRPPSP